MVEEAEEGRNDGGLAEGESQICAVPCGGGLDSEVMGTSDRTSSSYGRVMWVVLETLDRNGECRGR